MSFSAYSSTSSVSTTKGDGSVTLSWRTYYTTSGTLSSAQNPSVQGTTALVTANMSWSAFLPMFGTYTFGTHNPVTGVDVTLGSRTNSGQLADIRPTFAFTSLPLGINELWVAYSGDLNHSPWKSAYFQQWVIGQLHSVAVSPSPISFGEQLYSSVTTTSVTVTNTGNVPYAFTAISMAPSAFRLSASTCGGSLPVSASCSISVSFSPSYGGALSSTLTISDGTDVTSIPVSGSIKTSVTPGGPPPAPTAPTLSWISPSTGFRWGGTLVTITGTNLVNVTKVLFGSMPAPYVSCPSATTCYATAPAGYGSVDVRVMTPAGTTPVTFSDRFTYFG